MSLEVEVAEAALGIHDGGVGVQLAESAKDCLSPPYKPTPVNCEHA